jgi:hypothetical protein
MKARFFFSKKAISMWAAIFTAALAISCGARRQDDASRIIGEIQVDPAQVLASGLPLGEVTIRVHYGDEDETPVAGAYVTLFSSRNDAADPVDLIEQPSEPTDENGLATAYIGSLATGEAVLTAEVDDEPLCGEYDGNRCVPAEAVVQFVSECEEGLVECNGECVDTQTDLDNCGECGNVCEFDHADAICDAGSCLMANCHEGWDDCNGDPADGCETDLLNDRENCASCGHVCEEGLVCIGGECVVCPDDDNDGFPDAACGGTDCDDENENPDADEVCDGDDNDCDGLEDEQPEASLSCDDGDVCNGPERCFLGRCEDGVPLNCEDGNDCTEDTCDSETGCQRVVLEDGTLCGEPIVGPCDSLDECLGGTCIQNVEPSGIECRAAAGVCDEAETCDGVNPDCPADEFQPTTLLCRAAAGECDADEFCDGTSATCPADAMQPATVECRTATGACDLAENCTGTSPACPADGVRPATAICRAAAGACDMAERCDGTNKTCPADAVEPPVTTCRPSAGDCDAAENCDGENPTCPADAALPDGTLCTSNGVFCDGVEACQSGVCSSPGNPCPDPSTCDEANDSCGGCGDGIVSGSEDCDPGLPQSDYCCDPGDCTWVASGQPDPQGICSGAPECRTDICNGSGGCALSNDPDGTACGSASDTACDNPDTCLSGTCRANLEPSTTVCRAQSGICDVAERCDGVSPTCPADAVQPPTMVCRASTGVCDAAENCDGVGKTCPADAYAPSGTPCPDADPCTDDTCDGSNHCVSVPSSDPSLNPGWECVEATCDGIDNDCDGCADEGCGGDVVASVKVIPYSDGPGLRRISGNGWFGPASRELPGKLVVQLNDGSGNPMPCEPITFAVEAAGTVCYGRGGRFNSSAVGSDPVIWRVCNDVDTSTLVGESAVVTDEHGQASVGLSLADMTGTTVVSATAESTGEMVFFAATAVGRLSSTLTLPPPSPTQNPALGPLDVTVGGAPSRTYMANKANYTITIDGLSASTGSTNGVPSAPLTSGGTLTITGTQFTASVIVNDGTDTTFRNGSGCIPSAADAMANLWRVAPSPPVFISAPTGSLSGSSVKVKVLALDSCGNALPLAGRTVTVWTENPNATTPSTAVQVGTPDSEGIAVVSALASGAVRSALIAADVNGVFTSGANKAVVVAVPIIQPGAFSEDSGLGNSGGLNSVVYRGGDQSGGLFDTVHVNPAFRLQSVDMASYETNWMCTVGIVSSCECPAAGTALSSTCGRVYETEKNMVLGTVTGEGDIVNLSFSGDAAVGGTVFLDLFGGYSAAQGSGGVLSVLSAQISYEVFISSDIKNVEGTVHTGWLRQTGSEQEIETAASGLEIYDDRDNTNPSDDEIRNVILRVLLQRSMP